MPRVSIRRRQTHIKGRNRPAVSRAATGLQGQDTRPQAASTDEQESTSSSLISSGSSSQLLQQSLHITIPVAEMGIIGDSEEKPDPLSLPMVNVSHTSSLIPDLQSDLPQDSKMFALPEEPSIADIKVEPLQSPASAPLNQYQCSTPEFVQCSDDDTSDLDDEAKCAADIPEAHENALLTESEKRDLLLELRDKVSLFLRKNWTTCVDDDGLHILLLSRNMEKAVQRRLYFSVTGEVQFSFHCKPLDPEFIVKAVRQKVALSKDNLGHFVGRIVDAIEVIRAFEICVGIDSEELKDVWQEFMVGFVDKNPFQECRYSETYRSNSCKLLVSIKQWRCKECVKMYVSLLRRAKSSAKDKVHKFTRNAVLTKEQSLSKLALQKKEIVNTRRKLERLQQLARARQTRSMEMQQCCS